jgi:hypothetical protein
MTRKDYELIALSIYVDRDFLKTPEEKATADYIAKGLADQLSRMNPRFDEAKFLTACGYGLE